MHLASAEGILNEDLEAGVRLRGLRCSLAVNLRWLMRNARRTWVGGYAHLPVQELAVPLALALFLVWTLIMLVFPHQYRHTRCGQMANGRSDFSGWLEGDQ